MGEDPIVVAPNIYSVLFENERVRLLQVNMAAGESSPMHSHPDYLIYALGAGRVTFTSENGETADVELNAGDVMWRDAETHAVDAGPRGEARVLLLELK